LKLYYFPVAPNPTKVRLYLAEKGIRDVEMVRVNLGARENRTPEFLAKNPEGKLPVLELDDGSHLTESLAIIEYLEELHPEPPMIGCTPEERARVRSVERMADTGVLMSVGRAVHATRSPLGLPPNPPVAEHAREGFRGALALLDGRLAKSPFLAGERVTIADCTLFAALGFGSFFGIEPDSALRNLARWRQEFGARPSTKLPA
jgi:glutathione S-transferase